MGPLNDLDAVAGAVATVPDGMKNERTIATVPSTERSTAMKRYIGLVVSIMETAMSIRQDDKRVWWGKRASDPQLLAAVARKCTP